MSSSDALKWLNENFNFVDSVTIIDHSGTIITKQRFNPRYTDEENAADNQWALGKNLLEVFPGQNFRSSALLAALKTNGVIYRQQEIAWNHLGKKSVTNNLTIPIVCRGQFVGSVQLSRDVTNMGLSGRTVQRAREESSAPAATGARYTLEDIVGQSPEIQEVRRLIQRIANSSSSVLVYGETGTGKELVVSSIHNASYRKDKTFMPINCAALPESILESLLFGTRRGAFTGAEDRVGLIEECSGGTIYLDEINSMPLLLQAKLLRVLQEKSVTPLGASKPIPLDVRIIASTNRPISEVVASGQMREDILYRLNTISIQIPPLRRRLDDIPLLAAAFVEKYSAEMGKQVAGVAPEVTAFLMNRSWRGNVRELEHVIESAMNVVEDGQTVELEHLPIYLSEVDELEEDTPEHSPREAVSLNEALAAYEKKLILAAMKASNWKIVDAAARLRIPRTSLQYKLEKYDIKRR